MTFRRLYIDKTAPSLNATICKHGTYIDDGKCRKCEMEKHGMIKLKVRRGSR